MSTEASAVVRSSSGISGLDHILSGGYPEAGLYLIQGNPGLGKTTLAMQFLLAGVRRGESCRLVFT
jgi:circadian clock protein KaiC